MTEMLMGMLMLLFVNASSDGAVAEYHVTQKLGSRITTFDGRIAFQRNAKDQYRVYCRINEYIAAPAGGTRLKHTYESILRNDLPQKKSILLDRLQKVYSEHPDRGGAKSWVYSDFPHFLAENVGIDLKEEKAFLVREVMEGRKVYFNRLENGGYIMRVKNETKGNLTEQLMVQVQQPAEKDWLNEPYVMTIVFDIQDEPPADSVFEVPESFARVDQVRYPGLNVPPSIPDASKLRPGK